MFNRENSLLPPIRVYDTFDILKTFFFPYKVNRKNKNIRKSKKNDDV